MTRHGLEERAVHTQFITEARRRDDGGFIFRTLGRTVQTELKPLGESAAALQLAASLMGLLYVNGGTWTSLETFRMNRRIAHRFLQVLKLQSGIVDLTDRALTPFEVWEAINATSHNFAIRRAMRGFIVRILGEIRQDGDSFGTILSGRVFPVKDPAVRAYPMDVADAIEVIARRQVGAWFVKYREAVRDSLGILPSDWLHLDPHQLITPGQPSSSPVFQVTRSQLASAMVLLTLLDDKGPNLSTIQSYTIDSLERSNEDAGFVTGVKARNHQMMRTPSPAGGLFSYGGLLEFVAAATSVGRLSRPATGDFSRLLFVAHGADEVMKAPGVERWWKDILRNEENSSLLPTSLSFQRLRKVALLRGKQKGFGVIGQKPETTRLYLADAIPDVILIPGLLETQKSMGGYWRSKRDAVLASEVPGDDGFSAKSSSPFIDRLIGAENIMDVGVAACATNGQSASDENKPCRLGPIACFFCTSGFRTPELIPGLIAAVDFTENIRKFEPHEWINGDAATLNKLARSALDQFPKDLVAAVPVEAIANSRVLVACVYSEGRTNG